MLVEKSVILGLFKVAIDNTIVTYKNGSRKQT